MNIIYTKDIYIDMKCHNDISGSSSPDWGQFVDLEKMELKVTNQMLPVDRYFIDQTGLYTIHEEYSCDSINNQYDKSHIFSLVLYLNILKQCMIKELRLKIGYILIGVTSLFMWKHMKYEV